MLRKLLSLVTCILLFSGAAFAQGTLTGTVTDTRTGETLPGVNVVIVELERGAATNAEGEFTINNVPVGTYTVEASFVGFKKTTQDIEVGSSGEEVVNLTMEEDIFGLEEVVVTGVGVGTQTQKLGFSVSKVGEEELTTVPASDVGSAIQAKIPGVSVVKASGDPSNPATIRLRGSTSLGNNQDPLIIVDGIITDGSLADINMQDVRSIEVVKGAAAASLYGSLAGNGVIQIITKRGSEALDKPQFTVRTEYGVSTLGKEYPVADTHPWDMEGENEPVLTEDGNALAAWPGYGTYDDDLIWDNPYPVNNDNLDAVFNGKPYNTNYVNVANSTESFNYFASFENRTQGGVVKNLPDYNRNSVKFNADYDYNDKFNLTFSGSYVNTKYPDVTEQGQGSNFFYSVLTTPPVLDFSEKNADGTYSNDPRGYDIIGSNTQNPLYVAEQNDDTFERNRYIMGFKASYNLTDNIELNARQSFDKSNTEREIFTPIGYQTPTGGRSGTGSEFRNLSDRSTSISEFWAAGSFETGDMGIDVIAKYLYEDRELEAYEFSGSKYAVAGIRNLSALDQSTYSLGSNFETQRSESVILNADLDYQDKLILGGVLRRDGSSSFGADERYQFYYRGSLAYRVTEDIDINNIQELKLRASYGISGQRPPFEAQYETYSVGTTTLVPELLGNRDLKPSTVAETEFGIDATFLDKFNATINYSLTNVTNDYLLVPLSGENPFDAQWQNIGEIENRSFEASLQGNLVQKKDFQVGFNASFSKVLQKVTDLGGAPSFTRGTENELGAAIDLFRFEKGVSYGAMYGNKLITSVDQLTVNEDGFVVNAGDGTLTRDDFTVNSLGHVIVADAQGGEDERPMYLVGENGDPEVVQIGDTQPDFQVGFSGNINYKNIGLFMVWDWSQGGDVYNYSKQLLYFNFRHADLERYTRSGFHPDYALASDGLYNASNALSHFVEDASYLKLREVSLSYTLDNEVLGSLGNYLQDVRFAVVGRNLFTVTNYTGYDPEVALRTNATNFKIDEYSYPNMRTFSGSVRVRF